MDEAVDLICRLVKLPCFQTTPESQKSMHTHFLAAQVQAALVEYMPSAKVEVEGGDIVVIMERFWAEGKKMIAVVDKVIDSEKEGVQIKVRLTSRKV
jgi:hypothetical protein